MALSQLSNGDTGLDARNKINAAVTAIADEATARAAADTTLQNNINNRAFFVHRHTLSDITNSGATTGQMPIWSGAAWVPGSAGFPRGHIAGLKLSWVSATQFTVSAGECRDRTGSFNAVLPADMTKSLGVAWAQGSGEGSARTGSYPAYANTNYAVWLIITPWNTVDVWTDLSGVPFSSGSYTLIRRIGWLRTDESANLLSFVQTGDLFLVATTATADYASTIGSSALATIPLRCPPNVLASVRCTANATGIWYLALDSSPGYLSAANVYNAVLSGASGARASLQLDLLVDGSSQIFARTNVASHTVNLTCRGWNDTRGRYD